MDIEELFSEMKEKQTRIGILTKDVANLRERIAMSMIIDNKMKQRIGGKTVVAMRGFRLVNPLLNEEKSKLFGFMRDILSDEEYGSVMFFNAKKVQDVYGKHREEFDNYMLDNPDIQKICTEPWIFIGKY